MKSRNQCDELEQFSNHKNTIISGIPESDIEDTETQARAFLNDYAVSTILASDIDDRAHRITRPSSSGNNNRPSNISVKFCC